MATKSRKTSKGGNKRRMPPPATLSSSPDAEPMGLADDDREPVLDDELDDVESRDDDRAHKGIER